jgi:uncharacterized damage-inducible protein DinB
MNMNHPKSDFDALRQDLRDVYSGHPWHGSSITDVLKGVDANTAYVRSIPRAHTIWELVLHMTVWTREVASRVRGSAPKSPAQDWPSAESGGGEAAWRRAQDDLAAAQKDLESAVNDLNPDDMVRWIADKRDPGVATGVAVGTLIRGLLQHHTYHQGQIALLKKGVDTFRPDRRKA